MKIHELTLHQEPFRLIGEGKKTIEMRLNDAKRRLICVGDRLIFTNRTTGEQLSASVLKIEAFPNFEELYRHHDPLLLGYVIGETVSHHDMKIYYTPDQITHHGVLAIMFKTESSENI